MNRAAPATPAASLPTQFLRFAMVGATGTAVQYLVLWLGVERCGLGAAAASGAGYVLGALVNYALNYFLTFGGGQPHLRAASRYFTLLAVGWCLNTALVWLVVRDLHWHYWTAQLLATGLGLLCNFAGSRWWAFRPISPTD
jgi:putative flippase GtrA